MGTSDGHIGVDIHQILAAPHNMHVCIHVDDVGDQMVHVVDHESGVWARALMKQSDLGCVRGGCKIGHFGVYLHWIWAAPHNMHVWIHWGNAGDRIARVVGLRNDV